MKSFILDVVGFIFFTIVIFSENELLQGFYVAHVAIIAFIIFGWFIGIILKPDAFFFNTLVFGFMLILFIISSAMHGFQDRFYSELVKIAMIILSIWICRSFFSIQDLLRFIRFAPVILSLFIIYKYFDMGIIGLFSYGGRLAIPSLGASSNTLALIVALNLLGLQFSPFYSTVLLRVVKVVTWVFLLGVLALTYSRGGFFAYFIGTIGGFGIRRLGNIIGYSLIIFAILLGSLLILSEISPDVTETFGLLQRYTLRSDIVEGADRTLVWSELFNTWIKSPSALLTGFGPGSIHLYMYGKIYRSAHSIWLATLYYFGVLGLMLLLRYVILLYKQIKHSDDFKPIRMAVLMAIVFNFSIDTVALASQTTLWVIIYMSLLPSRKSKVHRWQNR